MGTEMLGNFFFSWGELRCRWCLKWRWCGEKEFGLSWTEIIIPSEGRKRIGYLKVKIRVFDEYLGASCGWTGWGGSTSRKSGMGKELEPPFWILLALCSLLHFLLWLYYWPFREIILSGLQFPPLKRERAEWPDLLNLFQPEEYESLKKLPYFSVLLCSLCVKNSIRLNKLRKAFWIWIESLLSYSVCPLLFTFFLVFLSLSKPVPD